MEARKSITEREVVYQYSYTPETGVYAFDDTAHVRNALEVEKHYRNRIKELIQKYGAAGISYYDNPYYYNASRNSYYCPYSYGGNHSVAVVGWDHNFYVAEA